MKFNKWSGLAGWFWLKTSQESTARCHLGCSNLMAWMGLEIHSQGGPLTWLVGQPIPCGPLWAAAWVSSWHSYWLPPKQAVQETKSEVAVSLWSSLWNDTLSLQNGSHIGQLWFSAGGNSTRGWKPGSEDLGVWLSHPSSTLILLVI